MDVKFTISWGVGQLVGRACEKQTTGTCLTLSGITSHAMSLAGMAVASDSCWASWPWRDQSWR